MSVTILGQLYAGGHNCLGPCRCGCINEVLHCACGVQLLVDINMVAAHLRLCNSYPGYLTFKVANPLTTTAAFVFGKDTDRVQVRFVQDPDVPRGPKSPVPLSYFDGNPPRCGPRGAKSDTCADRIAYFKKILDDSILSRFSTLKTLLYSHMSSAAQHGSNYRWYTDRPCQIQLKTDWTDHQVNDCFTFMRMYSDYMASDEDGLPHISSDSDSDDDYDGERSDSSGRDANNGYGGGASSGGRAYENMNFAWDPSRFRVEYEDEML